MFQIDVRADIAKALRDVDALQRNVTRAASAALNRVGTTARAVAAREISAETGLKVSEVKDRLPTVRANRDSLEVIITAKPWAPNLIRFAARQTKRGVSANAWRSRKVYRSTFIANKGRTVFKRTGPARLPIAPVYGPSVPRTFIRDRTTGAIRRTVAQRFPIEFDRALRALGNGRR